MNLWRYVRRCAALSHILDAVAKTGFAKALGFSNERPDKSKGRGGMEILNAPITFGHLITFWLGNTLMTIFLIVLAAIAKAKGE